MGCHHRRGGAPHHLFHLRWGFAYPYKWGAKAGNMWRTTPDIMPKWLSIKTIYEHNVRLYDHAGPGAWNDPDMLEVGTAS